MRTKPPVRTRFKTRFRDGAGFSTGFDVDTDFYLSTGLVDRNGTPIYEGDILRFDLKGVTHGPEREVGEIGEVWYSVEDACWAIGHWTTHVEATKYSVGHDYDWWYSLCDRLDRATLEVIGNVWSNPELLK